MLAAYEKMEELLQGLLFAQHHPATDLPEADLLVLRQQLADLANQCRRQMAQQAFTAISPTAVELYIQQYQRQLLWLADELEQAHPAIAEAAEQLPNRYQLLAAANTQLEQLLQFIEQHFSHCIAMDAPVPPAYIRLLQRQLHPRTQHLQQALLAMETDPHLVDIIFRPAQLLQSTQLHQQYTYHQAWYIKRLYHQLDQVMLPADSASFFCPLTRLLISINYNDVFFVQYVTHQIEKEIRTAPTAAEQLTLLQQLRKELSQLFQSQATPYHKSLKGTKELLMHWLTEEINYRQSSHHLAPNHATTTQPMSAGTLLKTNLSVPELGCLLRLLYEHGILTHTNQAEMLQFFASHLNTRHTDSISAKSLRNHYYQVMPRTADAIRSILLELVNQVRKLGQ